MCDHSFDFGDHFKELHHVLQSFLRDLVGVDLSDLGLGDGGGESADLVLTEGGHLLDLGEGGSVFIEIHPGFSVLLNVLCVVDQDLVMFDSGSKQDFLVV